MNFIKPLLIIFFISASVFEACSGQLLSTSEISPGNNKTYKINSRYWKAGAFYINDKHQILSEIKILLQGNKNTNIKLEGRLYSQLAAGRKCVLADNLIVKMKVLAVKAVKNGLMVTFKPEKQAILHPRTRYFFAVSGKTWSPNLYWAVGTKQSTSPLVLNEKLFFDTKPKYATRWRAAGKKLPLMMEVYTQKASKEIINNALRNKKKQVELWEKVSNTRPRLFITPAMVQNITNNSNKSEFLKIKEYVDSKIPDFAFRSVSPEKWYHENAAKLLKLFKAKKISLYRYRNSKKCINLGYQAAFVYLISGDKKYFDFALWSLKACNEFYKDRYEQKTFAYWFMFDRLKWLMAFDWIANDLKEEQKTKLFGDWLKYIEFFMTIPKGECPGGPTTGFYGVYNLKFYTGITGKGVKLKQRQKSLLRNWLTQGYTDNINCLKHRNKMRGKFGGAASSTLTYSFAEYLFAPFNFIYVCRSALNIDQAKVFPKFVSIVNYIYWNMIPASQDKSFLSFGYGDVSHKGNIFPYQKIREHLKNLKNIYRKSQNEYWDIADFVEKKIAIRPLSVLFIYKFLWDNESDYKPNVNKELKFPNAFCFENMGQTFMRSGFTAKDTYAMFVCGGKNVMHSHLDALSFVIYKNGFLAQDAGSRNPLSSHEHWGHALDSVCHNTILIHQPGEKKAESNWLARRSKEWDIYGGQNKDYGSKIIGFESNKFITYIAGDATKVYRKSKAKEVRRQFVFVQPDYFVIFDRVVSTKAAYRKDFILRTGNRPEILNKVIKIKHDSGEMLMTNLLPEKINIRLIEGFKTTGREFKIDQINKFSDKEKSCLGRYRIEISPVSESTKNYFLTFLQVGTRDKLNPIKPELIKEPEKAGLEFSTKGKTYQFLFNRSNSIGGNYTITDYSSGKILKQGNFSEKKSCRKKFFYKRKSDIK